MISSINLFGGTGRVCTDIANKFAQLNYEVTILSFYGDQPYFKLDPAVKVVAAFDKKYNFKLFLPFVVLKLRRKIQQVNPDILINVDSALFVYSLVSTYQLGIKNIVWEHFNFHVSLGASVRVWARRLAVKYADAIVTLTKQDKSNWEDNLNCRVPIVTIPNPSPFHNLTYNRNKAKIVLSAGRLTYQKGFDRLLDVWHMVKQHAAAEDWKLHVVGSGELQIELENKINTLQLTPSVQLIPATTNIQEHYRNAGIYCMASRFEGFGMVLIEAQAFGIPVVSYDCEAGPAEIISNDQNGFLVKDGDATALKTALLNLMENEGERLRMGEQSFNNSFNYTIDVVIENWIALFNHIFNKSMAELNEF